MNVWQDRHIPLEGAFNFRDFGGYPSRFGGAVRRAVLYRSDGLHRLSAADRARVAALGIRTLCDLRRARERERMPSRWPEGVPVERLHLPLIGDEVPTSRERLAVEGLGRDPQVARAVMADIYRRMVSEPLAQASLASLLTRLADDGAVPLLIHCSGGKDRTGVACALILSLLGVPEDWVLADYLASRELYTARIDLGRAAGQVFGQLGEAGDAEAVRPLYDVAPAYLACAFEEIAREYGDVEQYARRALRLGSAEIERIRANLLG
ncbi:MAG: protein-tyrosine-phosphatase [Porticoccaceae bacterium]|nr:MAG: protein-tyrosine-phosphatase [Porticoccaceae bacterium]